LAEPIDLRSKALGQFRLFCQNHAQSLPNLLNDCSAVSMVYVNVVAHNEGPRPGKKSASIGDPAPTPPAALLRARLATLMQPETAAFGYLRKRWF
jgi:hypothetical protein